MTALSWNGVLLLIHVLPLLIMSCVIKTLQPQLLTFFHLWSGTVLNLQAASFLWQIAGLISTIQGHLFYYQTGINCDVGISVAEFQSIVK